MGEQLVDEDVRFIFPEPDDDGRDSGEVVQVVVVGINHGRAGEQRVNASALSTICQVGSEQRALHICGGGWRLRAEGVGGCRGIRCRGGCAARG